MISTCWKPGRSRSIATSSPASIQPHLIGVGDLVEQQELVALGGDRALDLLPALAGEIRRLLEVFATATTSRRPSSPSRSRRAPPRPSPRRPSTCRTSRTGRPRSGTRAPTSASASRTRRCSCPCRDPVSDDHQRRGREACGAWARRCRGRRAGAGHRSLRGRGEPTAVSRRSCRSPRSVGAATSACTPPPAAAASSGASPSRTGPSSVSITCTALAARASARAARGDLPVGVLRAAVRQHDRDRPAARLAQRLAPRSAARRRRDPPASGVRPPVGSARIAAAARSSGAPGATTTSAALPRNAITRHAVAPRVRVAQQLQQRALDAREPPPRAHRAARVDDQAQQRALAAGADVLTHVTQPVAPEQPRAEASRRPPGPRSAPVRGALSIGAGVWRRARARGGPRGPAPVPGERAARRAGRWAAPARRSLASAAPACSRSGACPAAARSRSTRLLARRASRRRSGRPSRVAGRRRGRAAGGGSAVRRSSRHRPRRDGPLQRALHVLRVGLAPVQRVPAAAVRQRQRGGPAHVRLRPPSSRRRAPPARARRGR